MWIGISGKRGSGKTTAAQYLVKKYGFKYAEFAADLKRLAKDLFSILDSDLTVYNKERSLTHLSSKASPREILISFGNFARYFDEDIWIKKALYKFDKRDNVVIDGVRFENEVSFIKGKGGIIIRLDRYKEDNPYKEEINDISETSLDAHKFDFSIYNFQNTSLISLQRNLDAIIAKLELGK